MIPCEFDMLLGRYLDGEISAEQRARVELHLQSCAECVAELEQMRGMSLALRAEPMPRASAAFVNELQSLASNIEDVSAIRFVRRLTAAAAVILLAATVHWSMHQSAAAPPVATATLATDERMIIDPQSVVNTTVPDGNILLADSQFEPLAADIAGGRP